MLGFARAVGEAIAVSQVIGGTASRHADLFGPADTLAAGSRTSTPARRPPCRRRRWPTWRVLLLIISVITNFVAQIIVGRVRRKQRGTA